MRKFEFTDEGKKIELESKSHAGIFRQFWAHFFEKDVDRTLQTIDAADIRTSHSELFVAKNGSKKKNILIPGHDVYVYTHLSPSLMFKAYAKFLAEWNGETQDEAEQEIAATETEEVNEAPEEQPQEETPDTRTPEEIGKDEIAEEDYGTPYSELLPSQKGVVSKKYKKKMREMEEAK